MIFSYLPKELINIILEYDGKIKYRNGIYMNQLDLDKNGKMLLNLIFCIKII